VFTFTLEEQVHLFQLQTLSNQIITNSLTHDKQNRTANQWNSLDIRPKVRQSKGFYKVHFEKEGINHIGY